MLGGVQSRRRRIWPALILSSTKGLFMLRKTCTSFALTAIFILTSCAAPVATSPAITPSVTVENTIAAATLTSTNFPTLTTTPMGIKRVVGYYAQWAAARGSFVAGISAAKLTHINYAFSNVSDQGACQLGDPAADVQRVYAADESVNAQADTGGAKALHGNFNQLLELKQKYPALQVLISVGGYSWSDHFSDAALTDASRQAFVKSCIDLYIKQYKGVFDGIDIDWEYPGGGGLSAGRPEDKHNFTLLLADLRKGLDAQGALDGKHYLLTIAAPAGSSMSHYELADLIKSLDWLNLMAYDMHGTWETMTGFNAPLYKYAGERESSLNGDAAIQSYLAAGVPAAKLVLGVPFYGHGWKGVPSPNNGLHQQTSQGAAMGLYEVGSFDYKELKKDFFPVYTRYWDEYAQVPWLYNANIGIWISYDDPQSLAAKAGYARDKGLGGIMIWELSQGGEELLDAIQKGFQTGGLPHLEATPDPKALSKPRPFTQQIHEVNGINIDGKLDDWPADPTFTLDNKSQLVYTAAADSWSGPQDISTKTWVGWAPEGLYFAFKVIDDKHVQTASDANLWHGDYMELQIDAQLEKDYTDTLLSEDDYQFGFSAGDFAKVSPAAIVWFGSVTSDQMKEIKQAQVQTPDGYIMEVFLPKDALQGITLAEGADFGMNVNASDSDGAGQEAMLSTSSTRALTDPTTFGKIVLVK